MIFFKGKRAVDSSKRLIEDETSLYMTKNQHIAGVSLVTVFGGV